MSPDALQVYISLAGLLLGAVGVPLLYVQLRDVKRSVQAGAHAAIYAQASDIRAHLIDHPHLRRYFFDGEAIERGHEEYDRVLTIAELFLNYLEHISVMEDAFGDANRESLDRFCQSMLDSSPILRERLADGRALYSESLVRRLASFTTTARARPSPPNRTEP